MDIRDFQLSIPEPLHAPICCFLLPRSCFLPRTLGKSAPIARCSFIPQRICGGLSEPRTPAFSTSDPGTIRSTIVFRNSQLVFSRYFTEHRETFCQACYAISAFGNILVCRVRLRRLGVCTGQSRSRTAKASNRPHWSERIRKQHGNQKQTARISSSNLSILLITQKHCWQCCFRLECHVLNVASRNRYEQPVSATYRCTYLSFRPSSFVKTNKYQ